MSEDDLLKSLCPMSMNRDEPSLCCGKSCAGWMAIHGLFYTHNGKQLLEGEVVGGRTEKRVTGARCGMVQR